MNNKKMQEELNKLLSNPPGYYKKLIIRNNLKFNFKKPVVLFGAAKLGSVFIRFFEKRGTKILALSDNNKLIIGKKLDGIEIVGKSDVKNIYGKNVQIVVTSLYFPKIIKDLNKKGFTSVFNPLYFSTLYAKDFDVLVWKNDIKLIIRNAKQIKLAYRYLSDNKSRSIFLQILKFRLFLKNNFLNKVRNFDVEYFDKSIIRLSDNEVFLDGGAYDGDSIKIIIKESKNRFKSIYAFEPDDKTYKKLSSYVKKLSDTRIKMFKLGLGDKKNTLHFTNEGNLQSKIIESGETLVKIVPIDNFKDIHFTYIKLDIEGFEKKALIGSKKTIKKYKPKLVICVYHKANDLWELPILIKKIRPDYKLFLRQYSDFILDTICYAV